MYQKVKKRIFEILQSGKDNDILSKIFDIFIIILIIINVVSLVIETFYIPQNIENILLYIETISVVIFTVEYLLRVWTANLLYPNLSKPKATLKYIFSFMALIDLLAILPFYMPFFIPIDLRVLRSLRLVRLLRLFKLNRYTTALVTIGTVFKNKANQLLSSVFVVSLLMLISSILIYSVEHDSQPESFSNAFSGLWWAIATFTTIGYGDIYPVTVLGRILGATIGVLGIALVAVPTGIISAGFMEITQSKEDDEKTHCPYCGHKLD